jgi:signal transduction histidine kinase
VRVHNILQSILIQGNHPPKTLYEYNVGLLRGGVCLLAILVATIYLITDFWEGVDAGQNVYLTLIAGSLISLGLNRKHWFMTSTVVFLLMSSTLIYILASNDIFHTGVYLYQLLIVIVAFVLFGYSHVQWAIVFAIYVLIQFFLAYHYNFRPLPLEVTLDAGYARFSIMNNFIIALIVTSIFFYFLLRVNLHTEIQLKKKNELLQKTNEELDRFVYSTSHDMRAPLSSVLGLIEIAKLTNRPEELRQCLDMMSGRVKNLQDFIREITDYSRNERQELRLEEIHLAGMIKEIITDLRFGKEADQIAIEMEIHPEMRIVVDQTRLKIVLNNLIGNAFRYSDRNKMNPFVKIQANARDGSIAISVEDNGVGIAEEHMDKIFNMFYRGSEKSDGSGLGLYIAQEAARKMGGKILALSSPGLGSAFTLMIPQPSLS